MFSDTVMTCCTHTHREKYSVVFSGTSQQLVRTVAHESLTAELELVNDDTCLHCDSADCRVAAGSATIALPRDVANGNCRML